MAKKSTSKTDKAPAVDRAALCSGLREYWKLRKQEKEVNALDIRCACGLRRLGPFHFIFDGRAVIIKGWEDPHGREWDRLKDLMAWPNAKVCQPEGEINL